MLSHPKLLKTPRNPYLIKYDGQVAVFRAPFWRSIVYLCGSLPMFAMGIVTIAVGTWPIRVPTREGIDNLPGIVGGVWVSLFGLGMLYVGASLASCSGASKISFDIKRRTYLRVLLAPPLHFGKKNSDTAGWGNPLVRRVAAGQMHEIRGVQIVEREENRQRVYTIYAVLTDANVPAGVLYYCTSLLDAQAQLQEITSLLGLPALETMLMDVPGQSNRMGSGHLPGDASRRQQYLNMG